MTSNTCLVRLPASLGQKILSGWLNLKSLGKVDIAYCNHAERKRFLELLNGIDIQAGSKLFNMLRWIVKRKGITTCIDISLEETTFEKGDVLRTFFQHTASSVKKLIINSLDNNIVRVFMEIVALAKCSLIKIIVRTIRNRFGSEFEWEEAMKIVVQNSRQVLSEFKMQILGEWKSFFEEGMRFPALRTMEMSIQSDEDIKSICRAAPNLSEISLPNPRCTHAGLTLIGQSCPDLRLFKTWNPKVVSGLDEGIAAIATGCRKLKHLELNMCRNLTDIGLRAVAQNCPQLEELHVSDNDNISDEALVALAQSAKGLTSLSLDECSAVTGAGIVTVAQLCPFLHFLKLGNMESLNSSFLKQAIPNLNNICELTLVCCHVDDAMLSLIAANMPLLSRLDITPLEDEQAFTSAGLIEIALKCEKLQFLDLGDSCTEVSALTAALWVKLRPGMEFYPTPK